MGAKRLLAIDLGASGGKAFVGTFDDSGFKLEELHRFDHGSVALYLADRHGTVSERTHWNDLTLYSEIIQALRKWRRDLGPQLDALGIDTWGADGQWLTADGEMLGRLYGYRDQRLTEMSQEVEALLPAAELYDLTGIHSMPFNLSNQLLWFKRRRPEMFRLATKLLPLPTLLNWQLGGRAEIDSTWASVTQVMDARQRCWSSRILQALGIAEELLPAIVAPGSELGRLQPQLAAALGLASAPLMAVGSHDTASAFAAAPLVDPDKALIISSGTWSLVGRLVPQPVTTPAARAANLSNEGGIGNVRLLKNCMGTWIVQELLRHWEAADGQRMSWAEVDRLQAAAPPFSAMIDPDDAGFFNPPDMEQALYAYIDRSGQTRPQGRGPLLRLVYESLALKYRLVHELLNGVVGHPANVVHIVGGGSGNHLLNQFTANALDLPLVAGPREATALGNLMVQAVGLKLLPDLQAALPLIESAAEMRRYQPQERERWEQAYADFRALLPD